MRTARSVFIVLAILGLCSAIGVADTVGLGLIVGDDFPDIPDGDEIHSRLLGPSNPVPGVLVYFREHDWGMSIDFRFDFGTQDPVPDPSDPGWLDWSFAATYDWHPIPRFILDPFVSLGGGIRMAAPLSEADEVVHLGFHPILGAGLNVDLGRVYFRGHLHYQGLAFALPTPDVEPYSTGPYRVALSAGVLF